MYKAVLLDVYGTLVHDDASWEVSAATMVAELAGVSADVVARQWSTRVWELASSAYGAEFRRLADLNLSGLTATASHYGVRVDADQLRRRPDRPWLFADSVPFLARVGVPVCLVSDADRDPLMAVLDHHGISVASVVTSEDARAYKPRPEPFELALRRLGLSAPDVIHVGDSPASDIAGAGALGIDTAWVNRHGRRLPGRLTATYTVSTLTALLPVLG
ncbi:HAD family hydrolase [Asanoa ishikariensis]|uniref:HAD family hydrolase n=1 Tax=Asanoa ishikariensis TaxID=137265 RepID=UPI000B89F5B5|nr:HAD family hydrolase [Asanoa ishikariensis]